MASSLDNTQLVLNGVALSAGDSGTIVTKDNLSDAVNLLGEVVASTYCKLGNWGTASSKVGSGNSTIYTLPTGGSYLVLGVALEEDGNSYADERSQNCNASTNMAGGTKLLTVRYSGNGVRYAVLYYRLS